MDSTITRTCSSFILCNFVLIIIIIIYIYIRPMKKATEAIEEKEDNKIWLCYDCNNENLLTKT